MSDICSWAFATRAVTVVLLLVATAHAEEKDRAEKDRAADALFAEGMVPRLEIRLSASEAESLRQRPRSWTTCTLVESGSQVHKSVAIKIKGSYGSTRDLDDRPALTLKMDKHVKGRHFHGLDKFHLNNSVQDESLLREWLGADIFRAAGIPAPRVTHARLRIDGDDVGMYVLKESFDEEFLRRCFAKPDGNLYDGGLHQDIDDGLERDEGLRGDPGDDLMALAAACREPDDAARWRRVEELIDVEEFLTFAALEAMTGHWDGYCSMRNNYRVYVDPGKGGRARFLPHGMDQIFVDGGATVLAPPPALMAMTIMENPAWRVKYRERLRELLPLLSAEDRLLPHVTEGVARLRPLIVEMGPDAEERFDAAVADLRHQLESRTASLGEQVTAPEPILWPTRLQAAARELSAGDQAHEGQGDCDHRTAELLRSNVPWFECDDHDFERAYYRRWHSLLRHVGHTDAGPVLENLPPAFGNPLPEARWLTDIRLVGLEAWPASDLGDDRAESCDRAITGVVGLKVHPDTTLEVDPNPPAAWNWFAMDRIAYHGRLVSVVWDRTGDRYGRAGLQVFVDGAEVAHTDTLQRIVTRLP